MLGTRKPGADRLREPGAASGYVVTSDADGLL